MLSKTTVYSTTSATTTPSLHSKPMANKKTLLHKECFSFLSLVNSGSSNSLSRNILENREFFIEFLYRKNRRGLWNCFVELEQIKEQLMNENSEELSSSHNNQMDANGSLGTTIQDNVKKPFSKSWTFRQSDASQQFSRNSSSSTLKEQLNGDAIDGNCQLSKSLDDSTSSCKILISVTNDETTTLRPLNEEVSCSSILSHGVTILQIYDKIIRKFLASVWDVKNLNIDTVMTSSVNSLLGISRDLQRETCQKFEKHVKAISPQLNDLTGMNLWNDLFFTLTNDSTTSTTTTSTSLSNNSKDHPSSIHETSPSKMMSLGFLRKLTMKPHNKTNSTINSSSAALIDSQQHENTESAALKKKKLPSLTFGFKKLTDQEVNKILEKFQLVEAQEPQQQPQQQQQTHIQSILLFTAQHFQEIFGALHSELFQQLKSLFEQYLADSEEFEVLLMRRIIFTHKNEFPEIFQKKIHSPNTMNANPPSIIIPSNNGVTTTSLTAESTTTTSLLTSAIQNSENGLVSINDEGTASEKSDVSPSSPLAPSSVTSDTGSSSLTKKTSFNLQLPLHTMSRTEPISRSVSPVDDYSSMESPRSKLTSLLSFEEKKKKKKEKVETEKKVQTIQDQMNKYNKIISTLYKDLIQRDLELTQLQKEVELFEHPSLSSGENDEEEWIDPFENYDEMTTSQSQQDETHNNHVSSGM
ncbi:hypothetical protein C9374_013564 [Naegleria lovaniensis]|uniref:Uncharacterized protein n=1 Tax=Naegleria lovaniensis TaxID=51637 RepID=A0AA88KQS6_NAELO|nr:uncharacterized protein C9374_013564 [Naegleria lovaniensis]KAG2392079.1 hypothetical protein C9374_013564 [Naegleria lovaniensis]